MLGQQRLGVLARDAGSTGDEALARRHALAHGQRVPLLGGYETQVAVGDNAQQVAVGIDDGQPRDLVVAAQLIELRNGGVGADGHRVGDHARLGALDQTHLLGLILNGQIAVKDADAALTGHGDRHLRLGDGVHRRAQQGGGQTDPAGQARGRIDLGGDHVGQPGQQEDIVVGQSGRGKQVGVGDRVAHASHGRAVRT